MGERSKVDTNSGLLLVNGEVYTMDGALPRAEAVAVSGSRILAVGRESELRHLAQGKGWRIADLGGKVVLPGLIDCHVHFLSYALGLSRVRLEAHQSLADTLRAVGEYVKAVEAGQWVLGHGWNDNVWPEGRPPTREDLDQIAPRNPVALSKKDYHAVWVNSVALQLAGIDENTRDPEGGRIERDEATGEPTGLLLENATELVHAKVPVVGPSVRQRALRHAIGEAQRLGLTGIHDCDGRESLSDYQELQSSDELGLRVFMMIPRENLDAAIKVGLKTGFGNDHLRIGNVKMFCDGTLGSQTAELLEPFIGQPENTGIAAITQEELEDEVRRASEAGICCSVHAIGDRANRRALDAYAGLRQGRRGTGLRLRIEHVQLLEPTDVPRFKELDVIASMQPIHATSDIDLADRYWGERGRWAYAWNSLLSAGARLAFGSDAPVESPDPLLGIHAAATRQRPNGEPKGGWHPEQRLSVTQAVHGYTLGAAYASGEEKEKGSIAAGKLADLVVLSEDIFAMQRQDILNAAVVATIFGGKIVHGEDNL